MKKRLFAGIGAALLICSLGVGQALAAADTSPTLTNPPTSGIRAFGGMGGPRGELTDEQKAQMESARAQREEKLNAFIESLTAEQKALYEAAMPAQTQPAEGQKATKPDEATLTARQEKLDAFVATLSETQKATYDELFRNTGRQGGELTETQKAQMEATRAQLEEKKAAFIATLTEAQKTAYEALRPAKPSEGQKPQSFDESAIASMKAKEEAFVASLTEAQKAAYEELTKMPGLRSKPIQQ